MKLESKSIGDKVAVINVEGDITAIEAGSLKKEISDTIGSKPYQFLVLNMGKVNYIDSSGLGVLVSAFKRMKEVGGTVKLCGLQPRVKAVLDVTRMSQVFEIYEVEDEAVKSCKV